MSQREDCLKFETGRIKALQEERLHIQKKTFTKWMNSFLGKARMEVEDLFTDLADGKKLLKLLEIISGEKLGKPNSGKMRVHKIENVNKSLAFLHTKVRLESIGAEDIVDGNPRLILGLIWTIILRFQIQEIEIDVDEDNESSEKKSAKDALLLWCQRKTNGYSNVNIQDFTGSWRSGMGFNALIHAHRPDLIDYDALVSSRHIDNLNNAFDVAERDLGIPRLLDAEDIDTAKPDEKSVLTYVASYYHTFARMKNEIKGGRRIANIVGQIMDADKMKTKYEKFSTTLLEWIRVTISKLSARDFPNSLDEIQKELMKFKEYRTVEKPPKYNEKSEIEVCYFNINTRLKELKQPLYNPPDGQLIHDVERAWELLEKAEHQRELALREELIRQTHLEQLALRFEKKSILREGYLKDMIQVLSDPRYGSNLVQVEATLKKHEAISADILAREERCAQLTTMADYLVEENYHGKDRIKKRADEIMSTWNQLLALLDSHKINLGNFNNLMSMLREIDTISATIKDLDETFQSGDVGLHLLAVEDLLQKHSLLESQIAVMGETIKRLNRAGAQYVTAEFREHALLQNRLANLGGEHVKLLEQSKERRSKLEDSRSFFQFVQDHEEEEAWLVEKQRICKTGISAKDLRAVVNLQQKHKAVLDEMKARQTKSNKVIEAGQELMSSHHPESKDIQERIQSLQSHWNTLRELAAVKEKKLKDAAETYHFYADANEADSWIIEKRPLVASTDYGEDETSGQALLQRHKDLQGEIIAYEVDIKALNGQAAKLIKAGISTLEMQEPEPEATVEEEWAQEQKLVPQEFWEEEPIERTEYKTVTEERAVPQIKALYQFSGSDVEMAKGEVMFLLNKTNNDWWNVRKANGADGFVPANYVKEIEPKVVQVQVRKPEVIQEIRKVKKTKMVLQNVMVKKSKSPRPAPRGSKRPAEDHEPVEKRQNKVNGGYQEIVQLAKKRHAYLEDAIRLFGFYRECDDFEKWIREKEKLLNTDDKNETVESAKRKFEKFLTDLSASSRRVEVIDKMVDEFVATEHSQIDKVRMRQRQVHMLWDHLNQMKAMKERSLEGASSVELFNRTCDETRDWMLEKMTQIDTDDMGRDLKTVEALQRRHKNLERELAPIEEKISRVNDLANSVVASYPNEKKNVLDRQKEIQNLWDELTQKAIQRRARLEEAVGQQIFMNSSKNLLGWVSDTKDALNAYEPARDVSTAEALLKKHQDLGDDMRAHEDEFEEVVKLGASLVRNNPEAKEVPERLVTLKEERNALHRGWQEKGDWLQQALDLQMFNREADHIDTATSGHHAFLSYDDLGSTLDEVEGLMKRHQDFENTLVAQDERLKIFSEMATKLIDARHYDFQNIGDRRNGVLAKRNGVKDRAKERKENLAKSNKYHCFQTEVDDMKSWIAEKAETAKDESYKDLTNLERKLQKHEAFTRELTANEVQLKNINKAGAKLMIENERRKEDIAKELKELNEAWDQLRALSEDKRTKLNQADAQHTYNKTLENVRLKLDEMENQLNSKEMGTDRRACKENLKKHQLLESEMNSWDNKLADLYKHGDEMQADGHFDGKNIKKNVQDCLDRLKNLKGPADERRRALEELLRFYDFVFEIDAELQWIKEHATAATSETLPQDLHQAQTLFKKHKKLEAEIVGHHPMIEKTLANGANLISQKHPEKENITEKCGLLGDSWKELEDAAKDRAKRLDLALKAQQFFSDASEVETWMNEKNNILSSKDFGKDKDASVKLLTKHKGLELEMDSYSGLVNEMSSMAQAMVNAKHPDSKVINNKQETIVQQMKNLQKLANERRMKLMESMQRHEYFWESEDFEKWMDDQLQTAMSEDYGHDYEHLLMLQSKFDDFKLRIEGSSERFKMLDDLAKKLIASGSPYSKDIDSQEEHLHDDIPQLVSQKHEVICEKWNNLLAHIQARDQKLQAAGEIHRFNRDVADALARIQEKVSSIPEGVGRDVNSCESMLRIHESFEIDLLALEAQLQVLVDDAARLQSLYPTNAQNIREEQNLVIESWNDLQTRAAQKKEELQAAADFHRFSSAVRDLMNWSASLQSTMLTQEKVRDTTSAQILMTEHDRLKGEIEAREEKFQNVISLGQSMIEDEHSASKEVSEKIEILSREKERLQLAWEKKKIYLDQLIDLQIFLRDAKQLDTLCNSQEVTLSSTDLAETVEEVDAQLKKHDAFEKLLQTQEDKFNLLQDQGGKLIRQNHFESPTVKSRMTEVAEHRARVKSLGKKRRARLEDNLLYVQFLRDVAEAGSWIDEKKKKLEVEATQSSVTTLEEKIKKLKKHQAFEAELSANEPRILQIMNKGQQLVDKNHEKSKEIQEQMKHFLEEWKNLLKQSKNCGKGLEEAQDILDFNNQVEKVEAWIREKELLVVASDVGRDYEHCQEIQRKLDDVNSDMRVDDFGIKSINQLAEKLEKQNPNPSGHKPVEERKTRLNSKWTDLKGALVSYREKLAGALEIHAFNRDVDDTLARINEKMLTMSVDDVGKDLDSVESLLRRQDALERDMSAIGQKLSELTNEQSRLIHKFPEEEKPITDKLGGVQFSWDELSTACINRRTTLSDSYTLHKFMKDLRELDIWVEDMVDKMGAGDLPNSSIEAEALLQLHQERKAEILGRQDNFNTLKKFGHRLVTEGHSSKTDLKNGIEQLEALRSKLNSSCEQREDKLKQAQQLQQFNKMAEEADNLLADKEAFLNNDDLGDSLSSVELLIRKHDAFEKTLDVQLKRVDELQKFGEELVEGNHYSKASITTKLRELKKRQEKLRGTADARRSKLEDSQDLNQFLRNVHEVEGWILEKMQIATDECYRDMSNLQSKIQKHQAFESELQANESRVSAAYQEGEGLLEDGEHFASNEISNRLDELKNLWKQLQDSTTLRKDRLHEAYQALLFNQNLDDLDIWMDEMEGQLGSEDHGKDLTSVQHLLKKWHQLNNEFTHHGEQIEQIKQSASAFEKSNHFLKDDIKERVDGILKRYSALQEPLHIRKDNLEDALKLYQFMRDIEDELQWMVEKEPLAFSEDLGTSLPSVQSLQKKHTALEAEIQTHEPFVVSLVTRGQQMVRSKHFASEDISGKIETVQGKLSSLKDGATLRKLRLVDAVQSQSFYTEASEAETWMKEKKPYLSSVDYGKDEDSVQSLMKKLEVNQRDLLNFGQTMNKLIATSQDLIERNHFDTENIKVVTGQVKENYSELQKLSDKRKQRLIDAEKLFRFVRDADEVGEWIGEQMNIAGSEDYGRDVEHVEILIQKFEAFMTTLNNTGENRIAAVQHSADHLIEEGHPEPEKITGKAKEIKHVWEECKELVSARQEALHGAKQVHMFDRTADETIGWINEKDAAISSEDYGHDLESIQALVRKQQVFERDLAAVKEQVESVLQEARRLDDLFPDAREHIGVKHEETVEAWNELLDKSATRKDKLNQAEQLQAYFDTYRELLVWINETVAKVTAPELSKDVAGSEALISRHKEYKAEIGSKSGAIEQFTERGRKLIRDGHFLADEINEKVRVLKGRWEYLTEIWEVRRIIYDQSLDLRIFLRDAIQLESWLVSREPVLKDGTLGDSIAEAEEILKRHEDFEKTIEAQGVNLDLLRRKTMIEVAFSDARKKEMEAKKEEAKRAEKERVEAIKRKEVLRITDERKREDERRRTQEIKFNRDELDRVNGERDDQLEDRSHAGDNEASHWKPSLGVGNLFGDRLRRGSDPGLILQPLKVRIETVSDNVSDGEVKRSESFKVDSKKPKRTPSFTTRRRTQSFRKLKKMDNVQDLPPVEISGYLERKHELQSGGKRAAVRSWKNYYVVLCGQLLCFFKDRDDFAASKAATSPIMVYQAVTEKATDYTKRKHVFRLKPTDGSEYLFLAEDEQTMEEWVKKLSFHAQLPPSQQLTSYDTHMRLGFDGGGSGGSSQDLHLQPIQEPPATPVHKTNSAASVHLLSPPSIGSRGSGGHSGDHENDGDASSSSSNPNTPDTPRRPLNNQPRSREPVYANVDVLQQDSEPRLVQKPPIPPRTSSIDNMSSSPAHANNGRGDERHSSHSPQSPSANGNGNGKGFTTTNGGSNGNVDDVDGGWNNKRHSYDTRVMGAPPPLPVTSPPAHLLPPGMRHALYNNSNNHANRNLHLNNDRIIDPYRQVYSAGGGSPGMTGAGRHDLRQTRTGSLPPGTLPPSSQSSHPTSNIPPGNLAERRQLSSTLENQRRSRHSESSSESDSPNSHQRGGKDERKKSSGLMGLFRRKKATQL